MRRFADGQENRQTDSAIAQREGGRFGEIENKIRESELKEANAITAFQSAEAELDIQRDKNASDIRKLAGPGACGHGARKLLHGCGTQSTRSPRAALRGGLFA